MLDDLLLSTGASLEVDSNDVYYLKIRFFPDESLVRGYVFREDAGIYTDTFYSPLNTKQRRGDVFHRRRRNTVGDEVVSDKVVEQTDCHDIVSFAHCYRETELPKSVVDNMEKIIEYGFRRARTCTTVNDSKAELYLDTVHTPVDYSIVTMRITLKFNPSSVNFVESVRATILDLKGFTDYPVFTKFMLVLQCSSKYDMYDELYHAFDPAKASVPCAVDKVFSDATALRHNREYLWSVCCQIQQAQCAYSYGSSEEVCYATLRKVRPTGDDLILPPEDVDW